MRSARPWPEARLMRMPWEVVYATREPLNAISEAMLRETWRVLAAGGRLASHGLLQVSV